MSEIHGATGSYALQALDSSELDEFEAHLAACPTCSQEVVEFCEAAAQLSLLATAPPPPALKGSIMAAIGGVRVLPPDPSVPAPHAVPAILPHAVDETAPGWVTPGQTDRVPQRVLAVDELALRRARRQNRALSLAVAAVMVVALAMGAWVVNLKQQQQGQVAAPSLATQLYQAPDVSITQLKLTNGIQASFVASKSLNRALLTSSLLPDPGAGRTYQLWTLRGPQAIPDNLFSGGKGVDVFFRGDIAQATKLAVTIEPTGGSSKPSDPILGVAKL